MKRGVVFRGQVARLWCPHTRRGVARCFSFLSSFYLLQYGVYWGYMLFSISYFLFVAFFLSFCFFTQDITLPCTHAKTKNQNNYFLTHSKSKSKNSIIDASSQYYSIHTWSWYCRVMCRDIADICIIGGFPRWLLFLCTNLFLGPKFQTRWMCPARPPRRN